MSQQSKARAAKKREHLKRLQEHEVQKELKQTMEAQKSPGFSGIKPKTKSFHKSKIPDYSRGRIEVNRVEERHGPVVTKSKPVVMGELTPEMIERERAAQEEYEVKKSFVQPIYNKGGYQYPDAGAIEAAMKGELRRRS